MVATVRVNKNETPGVKVQSSSLRRWAVDPDLGGQLRRSGRFPNEALGMSAESGIEDDLTMRQDVSCPAVMDHGRRHQAKTGVVVLVVVPLEERLAEAASVFDGAEAVRETGRYLKVLNWLSENGLSSETCGRLWVLVTPRSASNKATGLEFMEEPRSAWTVSWPGAMFCEWQLVG